MTDTESTERAVTSPSDYEAIADRAKVFTDAAAQAHSEMWTAMLNDPDLQGAERAEVVIGRHELMQSLCGLFGEALYPDRPSASFIVVAAPEADADYLRKAIASAIEARQAALQAAPHKHIGAQP